MFVFPPSSALAPVAPHPACLGVVRERAWENWRGGATQLRAHNASLRSAGPRMVPKSIFRSLAAVFRSLRVRSKILSRRITLLFPCMATYVTCYDRFTVNVAAGRRMLQVTLVRSRTQDGSTIPHPSGCFIIEQLTPGVLPYSQSPAARAPHVCASL